MDINKEENLLDNLNTAGKNELKEIYKDEDDNKNENAEQEVPEEAQLTLDKPKAEDIGDNGIKKKDFISETDSDAAQPIGKKEMKTILLNLNSYWLELMGSITLIISLLIYVFIGFLCLNVLYTLQSDDDELSVADSVKTAYTIIINKIGMKWFLFITMSQHLSVGFFCMTTFSNMFRETQNIKKFYIVNFIKVALFYALSVIILKVVIRDGIGDFVHEKIKETGSSNLEKIMQMFDEILDKILYIVANFLATFNTFIEKLTIGSLYIFLFHESDKLKGKGLLCFRLCSLIPILYMIVSMVLRALQNTKVLVISEFISPLLLGPKITVYLFFISTLLIIKYKSLKYNVFDEENSISPKVFTKIGSRNFGILGIIELIIGLFYPSWSPVGIGGKYLLVLCAPIMTLYDYKRKYELKFPCCGKGNFTLCIKLVILIIGYIFIIAFGIVDVIGILGLFAQYIVPIIEIINDNLDVVGFILDLVL